MKSYLPSRWTKLLSFGDLMWWHVNVEILNWLSGKGWHCYLCLWHQIVVASLTCGSAVVCLWVEALVQSQSAGNTTVLFSIDEGGQVVCYTRLGGLWGFLLDRFLQNGSSHLPARLVVCHLLGHRVLLCFHLGKPAEHEKTRVSPMLMRFCFMVSNAHLMEIVNECPLMSVRT